MLSKYRTALERLSSQIDELTLKYHRPRHRFWLDALYCFLVHGSSPRDYINFGFYKLNNLERKQFVTMRRSFKIERLLNPPHNAEVFNNKRLFNEVFSDFVNRKWIYGPEVKESEIIAFIRQMGKVVVKPTGLSSGEGIHILDSAQVDESHDCCTEAVERGYLIEEYITQHPEIARLNASTVNTVRVYTLIDKTGVCEIIFAMLRVGTADACVDNFHSGGVGYVIDIDLGVVKQPGLDIMGNEYLCHPGTNVLMPGFKVPRWNELKSFVFEAANVIPESRYIGWDVALTEEGFEMVEGNYMADPGLLQSVDKIGKYALFQNAF